MRRFVLLALVAAMTAGCATLFASKSTSVTLSSRPSGAEVFIDGVSHGETPTVVELNHKKDYVITFWLEGREEAVCRIDRSVGVGWVVLDVLGGLIPVIVDAATGDWYSLKTDSCNVTLIEASDGVLTDAAGRRVERIYIWTDSLPADRDRPTDQP